MQSLIRAVPGSFTENDGPFSPGVEVALISVESTGVMQPLCQLHMPG